MYSECPRMCLTKLSEYILFWAQNRPHCTVNTNPEFKHPVWKVVRLVIILLTWEKQPIAWDFQKGEDEFKLNFPHSGFEYEVQQRTDSFLSAVHFWNRSAVPQPWLPFYLILPMTERTLFKLLLTFPLAELLHFKILIKAEPPVTSWFPAIAEAAANIKGGVTSLSWGQGVKLDNRLFVCGFSLWFPDLSMKPKGCERCLHTRPPVTRLKGAKDSEVPQQPFHSYEASRNYFLALQMLILWQTT